tara:strand:+ start:660 stop:815 length:156 start_codon:yes stop_codon:yes gene_type:complete
MGSTPEGMKKVIGKCMFFSRKYTGSITTKPKPSKFVKPSGGWDRKITDSSE